MTKHKHKRHSAFTVKVPPPAVMYPVFAKDFMQAERALLPRFLEDRDKCNPQFALIAIVICANALITGEKRMDDRMLSGGVELLKELWQKGYYTPSPDYPYTLEETLAYESKEAQS